VAFGHRAELSLTHERELGPGQTTEAGAYANQRLNLAKLEGPGKKCQYSEPDLGEPAVRDYRGAPRNVAQSWRARVLSQQPLHYASDCNTWNPTAQVATIECLIRAGANPNSTDKSGVTPIHRAVRTRCAAAVQALLFLGAKPDLPNKNGSTPLHLAVQNTGRGGSGGPEAVEQQREIILLLLQNGAPIKHKDGSGKTVEQAATVG
jgi:hypothetical protein